MSTLHLAGFIHFSHVVLSHAIWRHPQTELGFLQPEFYQTIAQTLELFTLVNIGWLYGQRVLAPQVAGTPQQIAGWIENLFRANACDGCVISPAHLPRTFTEILDWVVPELQHRGVFRSEYTTTTLRDHLQLPNVKQPVEV